jgi:SynChlorMet cassette radical SAM/SPASM protein ScmE
MKMLKAPISIDMAITNRCNLRCKYCSHFSSTGDVGEDLPKEIWLNFFEELNHCGVMYVTFQGGEPFFRNSLRELIVGVVHNQMRFSILSNGTLITDEMADFLSSTGRCDNIQISIDGSIPMTHDAFRGEGNFYKAIEGIKALQRHGVPVSVRVTIHRQNVRELDKVARLLLEDIGIETFSINAASYMGLCRQNTDSIQLTTKERCIAMDSLLELNERYSGRISATAGPLAEGNSWLKMQNALKKGINNISGGGYLTACNGLANNIAVRADGVIIPCIQMSHIALGHINKDDLREIWQNHPELKRLRNRHKIPLSNFEFCRDCDYINFCTGNCPALAYLILDEDSHPSPDACLKRFLEDGGRLPDANLLSQCLPSNEQ